MFGVLKPSGCHWNCRQRAEWMGHLCGTCLALRDATGQASRLATNYDAAMVSVLCDAQAAVPLPTTTHVCPLRGFRRAEVISSSAPASRYAASLSTLMAAVKIEDHVADGDGWIGRLPAVFSAVARRWKESARLLARAVGFDTSKVEGPVARQGAVEAAAGRDFLEYSGPTEESVAAAFAHTATLAERPENHALLWRIGRHFGRLVFLFDSYRDLDEDRRAGSFNALAQAYPAAEIGPASRRLFRHTHRRIRALFPRLALRRPELARRLLIDDLDLIGRRTLASGEAQEEEGPLRHGGAQAEEPRRQGLENPDQKSDDDSSTGCCGDCCCDCCCCGDCCDCCCSGDCCPGDCCCCCDC